MADTPDPLAGSYFVEALTDQLEAAAQRLPRPRSTRLGGALAAIEAGYQQRQIQEAAYRVQREVEAGEQVVVGVNRFTRRRGAHARRSSASTRRASASRSRASGACAPSATRARGRGAMERARQAAARGTENLVPAIIDAVKARATLGEISDRAARRLRRAPRADHGLMDGHGTRTGARFESPRAPGAVHHVAVVVRDLEAALGFYRDTSACRSTLVMPIESDGVTIAFLPVGESKIELVEPTDDTTGVARFLANKGEGFHHVCFEVADIAAALDRLAGDGHRADRHAPRRGAEGPVAFLHPRSMPRRAGRADRGRPAGRRGYRRGSATERVSRPDGQTLSHSTISRFGFVAS